MFITNDTILKDVVEFYPEYYEVFTRFNIRCLSCYGMLNSTLQECADFYNIDVEELKKELKQLEIPLVDKS